LKVIVSLGEEIENCNMAFGAITALGIDEGLHWYKYSPLEPHINSVYFDEAHTKAISGIMAHAWWQRVWTVQEVLLAREFEAVCGKRSMDGKYFFGAIYNYRKHFMSCCSDLFTRAFRSAIGDLCCGSRSWRS
jgi:hypothetical protein